jgi:glycosyltransferase involved in cell wall biosynthesis
MACPDLLLGRGKIARWLRDRRFEMKEAKSTVLFVGHDGSRTGAPIFLLRFLTWLKSNREVTFRVLLGRPGELLRDFEALSAVNCFVPEAGALYQALRRLRLTNREYSERTRSIHEASLRSNLGQGNIGLVYANSIVDGHIVDFLSFLSCPVVCHVHELEPTIRHFGTASVQLIKQHRPTYIAASQAVKDNLSKNHAISESEIQVVHEFIPAPEGLHIGGGAVRSEVRHEMGIPDDAKLICACGSIEGRKGPDLFLQTAERVLSKGDKPHFIWVGGLSKFVVEQKRREVASLPSLRGLVHFIGPRPEVGRYYDAADVFFLSSREDPFPIVMLEAALHGKPIVCFGDSGGAPEFVEGDAGFVVPGFNTELAAQKLADLLSSSELRGRMGWAGRQKVLARHSLESNAPKIAAIIEQQLAIASRDIR